MFNIQVSILIAVILGSILFVLHELDMREFRPNYIRLIGSIALLFTSLTASYIILSLGIRNAN